MVTQFAFGKSLDALSDPDFRSLPVRVFQQYLPSLHVIKAFPFVRRLHDLPLWIGKRISHAVEMGHELEQVVFNMASAAQLTNCQLVCIQTNRRIHSQKCRGKGTFLSNYHGTTLDTPPGQRL